MLRVLAALLLASLCPGAWGHDPGISEIKLCIGEAGVLLTWELASADAHHTTDVAARWGDTVSPARRTGQSPPSHHQIQRWWEFDANSVPEEIALIGLDTLPFGHRVVAAICGSPIETVLSANDPLWQVSTEGVGDDDQRQAGK